MTTPTGSPTTFSGTGRLEFAPTNNPDDPNPTWTDITVYLRTEDTPLQITRGRQSELDVVQPSVMTCVLDNTDGRFTYGLTTGAYGSNWAPAKKIRYSELANGTWYVLFTGWIEYPDIASWQPIGLQYVQLSATDRLTRLARARRFISTLSEHIILNGGASLKAYWPLNDGNGATSPGGASFVAGMPTLTPVTYQRNIPAPNAMDWATRTGPSGDDVSYAQFSTRLPTPSSDTVALNCSNLSVTLSAGQTVALIGWFYCPNDPASAATIRMLDTSFFNLALDVSGDAASNQWRLTGVNTPSGATGTVTIPGFPTDVWCMAGLFVDVSTGAITGCLNGQTLTGALGGSMSGTLNIAYGYSFKGSGALGHMQLLVGDSMTVNPSLFLAQYKMGLYGLEQQTTGQRISTILDYAGVSGNDRLIDPGQSYMNRAKLAGQTPGTALANAVGTERGRGFAGGDGRYVFHDRQRIYNV